MSALDPRLPGTGITFRTLRDDGLTFAGVTVPAEGFQLAAMRAKLAAAPGLSAAEIARANAPPYAGFSQPRGAVKEWPGWGVYVFPATTQLYIVRDDGSHLSWGNLHHLYRVQDAIAALNTTVGLSAAEQARIASAAL